MDTGEQLAISDIGNYQRYKKKEIKPTRAMLEDFLEREDFERGFNEKYRIWIGEGLSRRHGSKTFWEKANT